MLSGNLVTPLRNVWCGVIVVEDLCVISTFWTRAEAETDMTCSAFHITKGRQILTDK